MIPSHHRTASNQIEPWAQIDCICEPRDDPPPTKLNPARKRGAPPKPPDQRKKHTAFRLLPSDLAKLDQLAAELGLNRSQVVRILIRRA